MYKNNLTLFTLSLIYAFYWRSKENSTEFQPVRLHFQFIWFWNYEFLYFRLSLKWFTYSINVIAKANLYKVLNAKTEICVQIKASRFRESGISRIRNSGGQVQAKLGAPSQERQNWDALRSLVSGGKPPGLEFSSSHFLAVWL